MLDSVSPSVLFLQPMDGAGKHLSQISDPFVSNEKEVFIKGTIFLHFLFPVKFYL